MKRTVIGAFLFVLSSVAHAGLISIGFEEVQAGYTPQPQFKPQIISNQFASLGIVFENALVGDCTNSAYGTGVVHLYSEGKGACGDYTPDIKMFFVNPNDINERAFTTFFSILVTDGNDTTLEAYDVDNNLLTSISTIDGGKNETLTLEEIGDIAWLNIFSISDGTGYDDIVFEEVKLFSVSEPVGLAIMGLALAGIGFSRKKKKH
ncbi:hypothetical protein [Alteromonas sp. S167]|uniref:hypothetical protein n=1 Tax=Alteromonas sp. S167 TaxID=3117402 RepID=UPI002FE1EBE6